MIWTLIIGKNNPTLKKLRFIIEQNKTKNSRRIDNLTRKVLGFLA
jgi:hypothetical protein